MTTSAALRVAPISSAARKTSASSFAGSSSVCSMVAMLFLLLSMTASTLERRRCGRVRGATWSLAREAPRIDQVLLGRNRETGALDVLLAGAREGESGVLALVGEAGGGENTLPRDPPARAGGGDREDSAPRVRRRTRGGDARAARARCGVRGAGPVRRPARAAAARARDAR